MEPAGSLQGRESGRRGKVETGEEKVPAGGRAVGLDKEEAETETAAATQERKVEA